MLSFHLLLDLRSGQELYSLPFVFVSINITVKHYFSLFIFNSDITSSTDTLFQCNSDPSSTPEHGYRLCVFERAVLKRGLLIYTALFTLQNLAKLFIISYLTMLFQL